MNGSKVLLDTNILILLSKQVIDVDLFVSRYDRFYVSIITYMEAYGYDFSVPQEKKALDTFFELVEVVEVNRSIADIVIRYRADKKRKIKLPDAIILATARYLEAELLTNNWDDFREIDALVKIKRSGDLASE